ncbi:MAG: glycoside hydrolase family 3 N-terminal domain-containing protein [Anaerolineales bacterium]|nr:MAG: glycoside hydrolase family 3 N-terminal domain-containing protein [Anaerolineales bacterium]
MRLTRIIFLLVFLVTLAPVSAHAQTSTPPPRVRSILNSMTPEERIGQLFLVSINGMDATTASQIHTLITRYHVGGVVLQAGNDNFSATDTLVQTHALVDELQRLEWDTSINAEANPVTGEKNSLAYVPLFIGIAQEGDGPPTDQILNGLTPLPSEMAIGATWNADLAQEVGEVRGRELAALGFNVFFGPSLDVLETPSSSGSDLGTRVFGGDPFWVGEMGRAFVNGLHKGSDKQLLVIAKHFPGVGGADRLPEDEVSTVRKSLEQLKQIELAPFFAVTGNAVSQDTTVDGLLVSHIRYQGFQGNIRATTKPISFDPQALSQIMALPQFSDWYSAGGLLISDNLGTSSVREFYASGGGQFFARVVARDAFLAGNDILYLGNIKSNDAPDTYTTTIRILDFFAQKYREDPAFAQRVDASVARILAAKLDLYGNFTLSNVLVPDAGLDEIGTGTDITFAVGRNSATLISPDLQDLASVLPLPPQPNERLVFITDVFTIRQCTDCASQTLLAMDALENAVLQLYGPQSGNQVEGFRLTSYSFQNLQSLLDTPADTTLMDEDLDRTQWIVISLTDSSQGQPALISRFLRERPDLFRDVRLVLFSFGAPYYFDTTTISKFSAYYALYSKQPQFVDVAARLLFQELTPIGASPVSVSAVGYDLISVMAPDAGQIIPLFIDLPPVPIPPGSLLTPEPTPIPLFRIGDTIAIRTGQIKDSNGHPVPDGTVVQFSMLLTGEGGGILQQVDAVTIQGIARASFGLDKPGLLEIRVASEPATISEVLQLDVSQSGAVAVTVVVPELTQSIVQTPEPQIVAEVNPYISEDGYPHFPAWVVAMLVILASAGLSYFVAIRVTNRRSAYRWTLGILLGGLFSYNLLVFGLFGITNWLMNAGLSGVIAFVFLGELLGFVGGWLWSHR